MICKSQRFVSLDDFKLVRKDNFLCTLEFREGCLWYRCSEFNVENNDQISIFCCQIYSVFVLCGCKTQFLCDVWSEVSKCQASDYRSTDEWCVVVAPRPSFGRSSSTKKIAALSSCYHKMIGPHGMGIGLEESFWSLNEVHRSLTS